MHVRTENWVDIIGRNQLSLQLMEAEAGISLVWNSIMLLAIFAFLDCVPVPVCTLSHRTLQHVSISGVLGNTPSALQLLGFFLHFLREKPGPGSELQQFGVKEISCVYSLWLTFCKHCFTKYKASWALLYLHCWCGLNTPSNNLEELVLLFGISRINGA